MKLSLSRASAAMVLALFVISSAGCMLVNKIRAKNELNETARTYKEGHFEEAEQHAKRALELDPNNPTAPIFIARVLHQQYKPQVPDPENVAKGHEAIDAYKRVLQSHPDNDEAYKAVSVLYSQLGDDKSLREWITARATNPDIKDDKRAEAYAILAGKDWDCAFKITEENKSVSAEGGQGKVSYKKPKDPKDFETATKCATHGLEEVNNALKFDANNENAWTYQASLFAVQAELAEMDGKEDQKAAALKKADEARKRADVLREQNEKRKAQESPAPSGGGQ